MTKAGGRLRAAIYAQYSTDGQRPQSIADQIESCRRECEHQGWTVVGTYSDPATAGSITVRPDYERLKHDVAQEMFDVVVVEKIDRLSDRHSEIAALGELLSAAKTKLHACIDSAPSPIMWAVLGGVTQRKLADVSLDDPPRQGD